ncbi:MAG: hypothetical protein V3V28_08730 [Polaribacter sp.]|uniref:hypothetical protein n=1 Tax=Polaribacter sp. TaxID=1920175 RepID=UPI002F354724
MKNIFILLLLVSSVVSAQKKEFKHSLSGINKVVLESGTKIVLTAGNTSELTLTEEEHKHKDHGDNHFHNKRQKEEENKKADKRKGLTPIYPGGRDNSNGFGFSIKKEGNILYVTDLKSNFQRHDIHVTLPKSMNISVDAGNLGSIEMEGFTGEIEASANVGGIKMKNVTGPITVDANVGKVDIDFDKVSQTSPITISTSVSEIDVALPANTKADLELRTQGTVYTNFDFDVPVKKGMKNVSGRKTINSKLNNGGVKIYIKSSMGNIYLRKK